MSANNWRVCPKCLKNKEFEIKSIDLDSLYGFLSQDKYQEVVDRRAALINVTLEETLREDWELGVNASGEFYLNYGCSCEVCGFSFEKNLKEKTEL